MLKKVNLLEVLGADIGLLGEIAASRLLPGGARGDVVALLVEGALSYLRLPERKPPETIGESKSYVSAFVEGRWPIHKSWFVPAIGPGGYALLIDPPRGLVKYLGKDDGRFSAILRMGLGELSDYLLHNVKPSHVVGLDATEDELRIARELLNRISALGDEDAVVEAIEVLRQVDLLYERDGEIYHVEVKTSLRFKPSKIRRKMMVVEMRQKVLRRLGLRPALLYITPRENWEIETFLALL